MIYPAQFVPYKNIQKAKPAVSFGYRHNMDFWRGVVQEVNELKNNNSVKTNEITSLIKDKELKKLIENNPEGNIFKVFEKFLKENELSIMFDDSRLRNDEDPLKPGVKPYMFVFIPGVGWDDMFSYKVCTNANSPQGCICGLINVIHNYPKNDRHKMVNIREYEYVLPEFNENELKVLEKFMNNKDEQINLN